MNAHVPTAKFVPGSDSPGQTTWPTSSPASAPRSCATARPRSPPAWPTSPSSRMRCGHTCPSSPKTLDADFEGRSAKETAILEGMALVQGINYLRRNLEGVDASAEAARGNALPPGRARVVYQPLGVVGIMSPWNFPVGLSLMPLATAIAAGNRAMIKPSEMTPATTDLLSRMLAEIFPEEQVAVVTGRRGCRRGVLGPAFRSPCLHRLDPGRQGGDEGRQRQPRSGDARARRQIARRGRKGLLSQARRGKHRLRQARQRRAGLRRARLRARPRE